MKTTVHSLEQKVLDTITKHAMCSRGEQVLVAVSGGPDSVVMLKVLYTLRTQLGITLYVTHFNHQLRGRAADKDEQFVKRLATRLGLTFIAGTAPVLSYAAQHKLSLEEAGRILRYDFFRRVALAKGITTIAVGHTLDDQAETFLMRIIKGTGLRGLVAIRPMLQYGNVCFIRPLITIRRRAIMAYIKQKRLQYREDPTNRSVRFIRNKIRHHLIPYLEEEFNPNIKDAIARLASSAALDMQYLFTQAQEALHAMTREHTEAGITLDRNAFISTHPALGYRIIAEALYAVAPAVILDFYHWTTFWEQLTTQTKGTIDVGSGVRITTQYDTIFIGRSAPSVAQEELELPLNTTITLPGARLRLRCSLVTQKKIPRRKPNLVEYVDYDRVTFPLHVRYRQHGDRFVPLGMRGHKKIKDFLIEKKIPQFKRETVPLVISGNDIVWVVPHGLADTCKITPATKKIVKLEARYLK